MFRSIIAVFCVVFTLAPVAAQQGQDVDTLFEALEIQTLLEVMQEEGMAFGDTLADDMLPGGTGPAWRGIVRRLHDPETMKAIVRKSFVESYGDHDLAPLIAFFNSEVGQRIVQLEINTRRVFLDDAAEEAARESYRALEEPYDAHHQAIEAYILANDLVEYNVVGALNSNYMFFRGLAQGGALDLGEEDMLRDVWEQEGSTRIDTQEWLFAFLTMAYAPLSTEEIQSYVALSQSPEGQAFNRALFAGFDQMYGALSLSIGMALARQMQGESL